MPVGKVMSASDVIGREEIEKSEFFNDWMRPQYITADHFGVRLCDDGATYVTLGVAPPAALLARHRDRYEQQFTLLVPHLTRALQINRLTAAARASEQLTDAILDAWSASVLVLDRAGRLIRFNRRAATLLEAGVLRYSRDRGLRASLTEEAAALEAAIATAFAFGARGAAGPVRLTGPSDGTVHLAWIVPLDASALVAGSSVPDYAAQTGLSRNTVRNQLAAVFAKTGTSRQSELLALIVRTLGRHFGGEA